MAKKREAASDDSAPLFDRTMAQTIKDSAQQIWLAGMGAFAKAQAEGTKSFDRLIQDGLSLQKKTQGVAEGKFDEAAGRVSALAGEVAAKAGQQWDKLESIFEQRTAKALGRLGVPTARDLAALTERIDQLAAEVARLADRQRSAGKAAKKASQAPAKKALRTQAKKAAPRTTRKKAASKTAG